mmetsp:Transcript_35913/g.53520  ORF Transcript_35913/g.53520 Transcript_35913/m.53520 type:complete len:135 (+) Transcript_35913:1292-1696(+)
MHNSSIGKSCKDIFCTFVFAHHETLDFQDPLNLLLRFCAQCHSISFSMGRSAWLPPTIVPAIGCTPRYLSRHCTNRAEAAANMHHFWNIPAGFQECTGKRGGEFLLPPFSSRHHHTYCRRSASKILLGTFFEKK